MVHDPSFSSFFLLFSQSNVGKSIEYYYSCLYNNEKITISLCLHRYIQASVYFKIVIEKQYLIVQAGFVSAQKYSSITLSIHGLPHWWHYSQLVKYLNHRIYSIPPTKLIYKKKTNNDRAIVLVGFSQNTKSDSNYNQLLYI